jgi:hypothetical protein
MIPASITNYLKANTDTTLTVWFTGKYWFAEAGHVAYAGTPEAAIAALDLKLKLRLKENS